MALKHILVALSFEGLHVHLTFVGREGGSRGSRRGEGEPKNQQQQQQGISSCSSMVDRPGRPLCTNVHRLQRSTMSGRPQKESGQPPGRPTESASLSTRHGRPARSTGAWVGRPTGRPTDGFGLFRKIC